MIEITVIPWLEHPRTIKLERFSMVVLIKESYYTRYYGTVFKTVQDDKFFKVFEKHVFNKSV